MTLSIWDTAGQERFHALGPIYYRDANGAVLLYDITDEDSFQRVKNWVKELRKMLGTNVSLCIAGNKTDLERNRVVSREEAERLVTSFRFFFIPFGRSPHRIQMLSSLFLVACFFQHQHFI